MAKPKTQEQLDRETDKRLLKKYGVGLDWYNRTLEAQGGGCLLCGSTEKTRRLHVDHDHSYTKVKVTTKSIKPGGWRASAVYLGVEYYWGSAKRNVAVKAVKDQLKIASVRGLLCFRHNKGLQCFQDDPKLLRKSADYLEAHQGGK